VSSHDLQCRANYPAILHFFEKKIHVPRFFVLFGRGAWDDTNIACGTMSRKVRVRVRVKRLLLYSSSRHFVLSIELVVMVHDSYD